MSEVTTSCGLT